MGLFKFYWTDATDSLKTSVSDGKSAIASAITDMGVSTSSSDSFSSMASNIKNISGSISIAATGYNAHTTNGHSSSGIVNTYSIKGNYTTFSTYGVALSDTGEGVYDIDILTYSGGFIWSNTSSSATIINVSNYKVYYSDFIVNSDENTFRYYKVILKAVKKWK